MNVDLSPLLKAATKSTRKRSGFASSSLFSLPEVAERSKRISSRHIETSPFRILDAPGLVDDFYLNLLDWTANRISIALGDTLYSYNIDNKEVNEIYTTKSEYISSIKGKDNLVYIGDSSGNICIFDLISSKYRIDQLHSTRISSIGLSDRLISSGSKSGLIINQDLRTGLKMELRGHTNEVCGLKWNKEYLASGSNDNTVRIWKSGSLVPRILRGHESAIKALDWCPWKANILGTGGGAKDKTIRFWDIHSGKAVGTTRVESQVCSLAYLKRYKEIVTSHGFQENDLKIWQANEMKLVSSFGSHDSRVLHTAISPDECSMVSLGADDSLKFWKLADPAAKTYKRDSIGMR